MRGPQIKVQGQSMNHVLSQSLTQIIHIRARVQNTPRIIPLSMMGPQIKVRDQSINQLNNHVLTNGLQQIHYGRTEGWMDQPSYSDATSHLKRKLSRHHLIAKKAILHKEKLFHKFVHSLIH